MESKMRKQAKSDAIDLVKDGAEPFVDLLFNDGLLKDVPIVGGIIKSIQFASSLKEYLFERKLRNFLNELGSVDLATRAELIDDLNRENRREEVGEFLLNIIDRVDFSNKAKLIGRIFKEYLLRKITIDDFYFYATVIDRMLLKDLNEMLNGDIEGDTDKKLRFNILGLNNSVIMTERGTMGFVGYKVNDQCKKLMELLSS